MRNLIWHIGRRIYRLLGPANAWRLAMSPPVVALLNGIVAVSGNRYIVIQTRYGFRLRLKVADYLFGGYVHFGETNPFEIHVLRAILRKGDTFFDVGAHMGWYALNASQRVGQSGRVFAFEPNPSVASWLSQNRALNSFSNISIERVAVTDKNGHAVFWVGTSDALGSLAKENAARDTESNVKKISVACIKLDSFFKYRKLDSIKVIKVDAEGADLEVLKGAEQILKRYSPYLMVEVYGLTWENDKNRDKKILSYVMNLGYRPYEFVERGLRRVRSGAVQSQLINLFFAKNEKELKRLGLLTL